MAEAVATLQKSIPSQTYHYELTLSDYWRTIVKRKVVVFATFIAALISAISYTNVQIPQYQASSAVRISSGTRAFGADQSFFMSQVADTMAIYSNSITSQGVIERVVIRLGLLPPSATAADLMDKVNEIRGSISAQQVEMTDNIAIEVEYPNPELAASIANQTAESFAQVDLLQKTKQARSLRQFVEKQLLLFSEKLKTTEDRIRSFRQTGRTFGIASGLEQQLSALEKEKNLALKQFTEKHPDVQKIDAQIGSIRDRIKKLPADEIELARLQRELEISDRGYRMMKEKYEQARLAEAEQVGDVTVVEYATVPDAPISPQKNLNKIMGAIAGLILGLTLAFVVESLDTSIGTIEDVERTVHLPVIGVIPFYNPKQEETPWWRPDKAILQFMTRRMDMPPEPACLIMNQDSFSTLSEAYRILRTFLEFLLEKKVKEGKIIVITSTGPQEGKSLTACNLAISLAQAGKRTILIDADLRRPVMHRLFGIQREPGLAEVLLGTSPLHDVTRNMGDVLVGETSQWDQMVTSKMLDRLEIVTTGARNHTPAELLGSDQLKSFLSQLRLQYDYIILDTPPVLPVTDARTLGVLADATFFVYRAGKTARRALMRAKGELDLAGVSVKGIILNHATPEVTLTDKYYYQYYGPDELKGKKIAAKKAAASKLPVKNLD